MRWVLAIALAMTAGSAKAYYWGPPTDPVTGRAEQPGEANYDPQIYARLLYHEFKWDFDQPDRIVLMGVLTPRWSADQLLLHQVVDNQILSQRGYFETLDNDEDAFDPARVSIENNYSDAYAFDGGQVTTEGLVPLPRDKLDYAFFYDWEGYMQSEPPSRVNLIFSTSVRIGYGTPQARVESWYPCKPTLPAPDEAALRALTVCIRNHGC